MTQTEIVNKLEGKQHVLLFGGSFDPPTKAHVEMPQKVADEIGADLIIYIPAKRSPHKMDPDSMPAQAQARADMLSLALQDLPNTFVWTYELDQEGEASFTIDTVKAFKAIAKTKKVNLLIGSDQALAFHAWKDNEEIVKLAEPIVSIRPPQTALSLLGQMNYGDHEPWIKRIVKVEEFDCSSTEVRRRIKSGESISDLVHVDVEKYIADNMLYQRSEQFAGEMSVEAK